MWVLSQALPHTFQTAAAPASSQWGEALPLLHLPQGLHPTRPPEHPQEAFAPRAGGRGGGRRRCRYGYRGLGGGLPRNRRTLSFTQTPYSLNRDLVGSWYVFTIGRRHLCTQIYLCHLHCIAFFYYWQSKVKNSLLYSALPSALRSIIYTVWEKINFNTTFKVRISCIYST